MDIHEAADREAESLAEQLENGEITDAEYDRYMRELRAELRDYEQGGQY